MSPQLVAAPARAGGNWIELNRRYLRVGAVVTARAVFFTRSKAKVIERGPYVAFLAPERPGWGRPDPSHPRTVPLGPVQVLWPEDHDWRGFLRNNPRARIRFEVPAVSAGRYLMAFCNRTCTRPLGDVDATGFLWVVNTPAEGRLRLRLWGTRERLREQNYRVGQLARRKAQAVLELETLQALLDETQADLQQSEESRKTLEGEVAAARSQRGRERLLFGSVLGLVVALAMILRFVRRVRRRRRIDEELTRLTEQEHLVPVRDSVSLNGR